MKRVIEPLELMGARIESNDGRAPLRITGRKPLKPITYLMPVASAQVKACVLLAGLNAAGQTEVIETPNSTRDHTERLLSWFDAPANRREVKSDDASLEAISVTGEAHLRARGGAIPGDISSAAFFIAAAALLPGSNLRLENVGLNPTRKAIIPTLRGLGVDALTNLYDSGWMPDDFNEPFGDIKVTGGAGLAPIEAGRSNVLSGALIPQLIDELPVIAVLGTQVLGGLTIREASELRVKETDRISATVSNLRAMGAEVEEHADGLTIVRRARLRGAELESHGDHRIAMAFTIAALIADGESEITGAECVSVSFPEFYGLLESVLLR